jgi:ADP-heptose:LPS heptosyltransferase
MLRTQHLKMETILSSSAPVAFHFNGFGDRLMALPAIRALATMFPNQLKVICGIGDRSTYYLDLPLREVCEVEFTRTDKGWGFDASLVATTIESCDMLVSFNTWCSNSVDALLSILQPVNSIGFYRNFNHPITLEENRHRADMMFELPRLLNPALKLEDFCYPLSLPEEDVNFARSLRSTIPESSRLLLIHNETLAAKVWSDEKLFSVLDQFLSRHPSYVVLVLDQSERPLDIGKQGARVKQLTDDRSISAYYAVVANAELFLGVDSCFLHAADLFRVPGVGLFGPTNPRVYGFRLGPHRHVCANGPMDNIDESQVLEALEEIAPA